MAFSYKPSAGILVAVMWLELCTYFSSSLHNSVILLHYSSTILSRSSWNTGR